MKIQLSFRLLLPMTLIAALTMTAVGAELRVALTPRVSLPKDLPLYQEDSANFYGTNTLLFQSRMLRKRVEMEIGHALPSTLKFTASRIPNTSIIAVTATGADDSAAIPFLNALVNQFLLFKIEQKKQFYREAITRVDSAMQSAPPEAAEQLQKYKAQLVVASLLDTESDFRRPEEIQ